MKREKTQGLEFWYKLAKGLATVAMLFWLMETVYFLIVDGWHLRAVNPLEIWADDIVGIIFSGVGFSLVMCGIELIENEIEMRRNVRAMIDKVQREGADKVLEGLKDEDLEPLVKPFQQTTMTISTFDGKEIKELSAECDNTHCGPGYCAFVGGCVNRKILCPEHQGFQCGQDECLTDGCETQRMMQRVTSGSLSESVIVNPQSAIE